MTLQPIGFEFLYILGKFLFLFFSSPLYILYCRLNAPPPHPLPPPHSYHGVGVARNTISLSSSSFSLCRGLAMPVSADGRGGEKERKKTIVKKWSFFRNISFTAWYNVFAQGSGTKCFCRQYCRKKKGRFGTIYKRGLSDRFKCIQIAIKIPMCCFITVDSTMAASQNGAFTYQCVTL